MELTDDFMAGLPSQVRGSSRDSLRWMTGLTIETREGHEADCDFRLVRLFDHLNNEYFSGCLPALAVVRGIPEDAATDLNGLTQTLPPRRIVVYVADQLFTWSLFDEEQRWKLISEVLIHEMVHVAEHLDSLACQGSPSSADHGQAFADECNRIGLPLGWAEVRPEDSGECGCAQQHFEEQTQEMERQDFSDDYEWAEFRHSCGTRNCADWPSPSVQGVGVIAQPFIDAGSLASLIGIGMIA